MSRTVRHTAAIAALVLLAGCSSADLGSVLGGGTSEPTSGGVYANEVRGTVDYVDTRDQFIELTNVSGWSSRLSNEGNNSGSRMRVYYDDRVAVEYQGRSYRPEDLERGDEVAVRVDESGGRYRATAIAVVRDVSGGGGTYGGGSYDSRIRGTVRYVDTRNRTIELDEGTYSNRTTVVAYSSDTYVDYQGRRYRPEDLQRGDEIEITVRDVAGRRVASAIAVTRNAGDASSSSGEMRRVRGSVWSIDTSRRAITLDRATWTTSRFDTGGGSGNNVVIRYDSNVPVYFQGRTYAVTNLERGDEIEVEVRSLGGNDLLAERINVLRDRNSH